MAKKKFYAVKNGRMNGLYYDWDSCKEQVNGFAGAIYKSFDTEIEAKEYLGLDVLGNTIVDEFSTTKDTSIPTLNTKTNEVFSFVDGSFNPTTKVYGYGGFLSINGNIHYLQGSGNDEEMASMRNVAGEILGSIAAIKLAIELGVTELTIYYDYMGIECWANKTWKRNKNGTIDYANYCDSIKDKIKLNFVHVKGHTGIEGNEMADKLAKQSVGL